MKIKNTCTVMAVAGLLAMTTGCMSIKDTAGLKQYLQDQGRAEILALDIKTKNPDKKSEPYKKAETLFNQAAGAGNGWTKGIVLDARLKKEVNVPVADYKSSDAGKRVAAFLALDTGINIKFDPGTAALIATFVVSVVDMLEKQNDQRVERAVKTIEGEFSKAQWTTFELTTGEWITKKYGSTTPDK